MQGELTNRTTVRAIFTTTSTHGKLALICYYSPIIKPCPAVVTEINRRIVNCLQYDISQISITDYFDRCYK